MTVDFSCKDFVVFLERYPSGTFQNFAGMRILVSRTFRTFHFAFETTLVVRSGGAGNGVVLSSAPGADVMLRWLINCGGRLVTSDGRCCVRCVRLNRRPHSSSRRNQASPSFRDISASRAPGSPAWQTPLHQSPPQLQVMRVSGKGLIMKRCGMPAVLLVCVAVGAVWVLSGNRQLAGQLPDEWRQLSLPDFVREITQLTSGTPSRSPTRCGPRSAASRLSGCCRPSRRAPGRTTGTW